MNRDLVSKPYYCLSRHECYDLIPENQLELSEIILYASHGLSQDWGFKKRGPLYIDWSATWRTLDFGWENLP